jgi:hypothetical protein
MNAECSQADGYRAPDRWTDAYAEMKAEEKGCVVEFADDSTLQLDIDSDVAFNTFVEQIIMLNDLGIVKWNGYNVRTSLSGNRHITVALLSPLPIETRILLQACLGSDRKRELLSYAGVLKGQEHPVLLFRPKENA